MIQKFLAEFIGTTLLIFFGCGAMVANTAYSGALTHLGVALVWGLVVMVMIYSVGNVSGAHMNPAVTLSFWVAKRFPTKSVPVYLLAQFFGASLGAFLLKLVFPMATSFGITQPNGEGVTVVTAFIMEFILSFVLMFVIFNISTGHKEKGIMAGVAVGATVAIEAAVGGPLSGASMNPARSFGPALVSGNFSALWVYLLAPLLGMLAAIPFSQMVQKEDFCKGVEV